MKYEVRFKGAVGEITTFVTADSVVFPSGVAAFYQGDHLERAFAPGIWTHIWTVEEGSNDR